jgi:hypothetical protein
MTENADHPVSMAEIPRRVGDSTPKKNDLKEPRHHAEIDRHLKRIADLRNALLWGVSLKFRDDSMERRIPPPVWLLKWIKRR